MNRSKRNIIILASILFPASTTHSALAAAVCDPGAKICIGQPCSQIGVSTIDYDGKNIIFCLNPDTGTEKIWKGLTSGKSATAAGIVAYFANSVCPSGWIEANGQSTAAYPALAAVIGGATPDLRGYFLRSWDHGRGIDPSRTFGSAQGDAIRNITGDFYTTYGVIGSNSNPSINYASGAFTWDYGPSVKDGKSGDRYSARHYILDVSRIVPTADENRPENFSLTTCISTGG